MSTKSHPIQQTYPASRRWKLQKWKRVHHSRVYFLLFLYSKMEKMDLSSLTGVIVF